MLPRWRCFHVSVLFSLQSGLGLPQWILSHFRQAPPLTDHTAAFKGLNEHQRQLCDFAFLPEHYNLWSFPPWWKSPSPLVHTAIFNDFPKTHSRFSGTAHHSEWLKWGTPFLPLHHAHALPMGKWRVVCESGGTEPEPEISNVCINDKCGWLLHTKYYLQLTLRRNYSSNPLQKEENQLTWQHFERG